MNQKQKALIVLKALLQEELKQPKQPNPKKTFFSLPLLIEKKIDACLELANPDILLDSEALKRYDKIVEHLKKTGKII